MDLLVELDPFDFIDVFGVLLPESQIYLGKHSDVLFSCEVVHDAAGEAVGCAPATEKLFFMIIELQEKEN